MHGEKAFVTEHRTSPLEREQIQQWIGQFPNPAQAELCVRYALMFNTLAACWMDGRLSPFVTYGSQSVFETLKGKRHVREYFSGKVENLRASPATQPRAELAVDINGFPCVVMFQPQDDYDRNWLDSPRAYVTFEPDALGLAISIFMITSVPSPASPVRSGIYPGVETAVRERGKGFVRPSDDFEGMHFSYFLLNGQMRLDQLMMEVAVKVEAAFPGSTRSTMNTANRTSEKDELDEVGFYGFPSVAVYWRDKIVYRHEGLIPAQKLMDEIRKIAALHVVMPSAGDGKG